MGSRIKVESDRYITLNAIKGQVMITHRKKGDISLAIIQGDLCIELDFPQEKEAHKALKVLFELQWVKKPRKEAT